MTAHLMTRPTQMTPCTPACANWRDGDSWAPNGNLDSVDCEACHLAIMAAQPAFDMTLKPAPDVNPDPAEAAEVEAQHAQAEARSLENIARICHEANRAYCTGIGDDTQVPWNEAPAWQKESAIVGVRFRLRHPTAPASDQHDAWCAQKRMDGWTYGPKKDAVAKTHPCLVPYDQLPYAQQMKDHLFQAIVDTFADREFA